MGLEALEILGKRFQFRRMDGGLIFECQLIEEGKIVGATHANESSWDIRDDHLIFLDQLGNITTEFVTSHRTEFGIRFLGRFLPGATSDFYHSLTEIAEGFKLPSYANSGNVVFITCTYKRTDRIDYVNRHIRKLISQIDNYHWIVVEDGDGLDPELALILRGWNATYLHTGPTRDKGHAQRNLALEYIRDNRIAGTVYNMDDDNLVHPQLIDELRRVSRFSVFPVGNLGPNGIERAIIKNRKFERWDAGWLERQYPVDMGGFAFQSNLIFDCASPIWNHVGIGGESEFISKLVPTVDDLDFSLCHWNRMCLVFHNEPLDKLDMFGFERN